MGYLKGLAAGTVTLLFAVVLFVLAYGRYVRRRYDIPSGAEIGFDLTGIVLNPLLWLVAILGFGVGFFWGMSHGS
jgi:hypothetical protein